MKKTILLCFVLGLASSCLLLNLRQEKQKNLDLLAVLQLQAGSFLGSWLWKKMDFYGHFGEWVEQKEADGSVNYLSMFKDQKEFLPLTQLSVRMDPSFVERVALVANTLGVSLGRPEDSIHMLQTSIMAYPEQMRIYRLYGEIGQICYQVLFDYPRAVRFFKESFRLLSRLDPQNLTKEDAFNIRLYSVSAGLSAFRLNDLKTAYAFYRMTFEPGSEEYTKAMKQMAVDQEPVLNLSAYQGLLHEEEREHRAVEMDVALQFGLGVSKAERQRRIVENNQKLREKFIELVPQVNENITYPISWPLFSRLLVVACILVFLLTFLRRR